LDNDPGGYEKFHDSVDLGGGVDVLFLDWLELNRILLS
jgi:hypothetical protein